MVLDPGRKIPARRIIYIRQAAQGAHRCVHRNLQPERQPVRLDQSRSSPTSRQRPPYQSTVIPGTRMRRLFIIGGSDAGISSALRAREFAPEWQVTVAVADRYPNFSICGIPYFLSQEVPKAENLAHRKASDIQSLGVELLLDHKVERIDSSAHRVIVRRPGGVTSEHGYDKLVVATGARSIRPPITGWTCRACFCCVGWAIPLRLRITSRQGRQST